jgi:hypothetical protein
MVYAHRRPPIHALGIVLAPRPRKCFFHGRLKNVEFDALRLLDAVLSSSELISDVRWHYDDSESP